MNILTPCHKCKIANYCDQKGSSPLVLSNKKELLCQIVGGYGRVDIDPKRLSDTSKKKFNEGNRCVSIVEVPKITDGFVHRKTISVFHPPVKHPREVSNVMLDKIYVRNHK